MRRKKKTNSDNGRALFQIFLAKDLAERLRARSEEESLSMSAWIRLQIVHGLERASMREQARQEAKMEEVMITDNYPVELLGQAEAALTAWYSKKGLKNPELEEKVNRVMRTQFPAVAEIIAAEK